MLAFFRRPLSSIFNQNTNHAQRRPLPRLPPGENNAVGVLLHLRRLLGQRYVDRKVYVCFG